MAEENVAVNDNTNAPQPTEAPATEVATPADPAETMLGGTGTTQPAEPKADEPKDTPTEYDFKATIPEGVEMDETITKEFSDIARGMNLTNEQANQMAAYGIKYGQQIAEAVRAQQNEQVAKWGESAKAEMGANFETIMTTAGAGIEAVEKQIPGIRQALNETGAGNRIEVIRAFEMLGRLVQADPGKLVNVTGSGEVNKPTTWYKNSNMK